MSSATTSSAVSCVCPPVEKSSGCRYANTSFVQVVLESSDSPEMSSDESVLSMQGEETGSAKSMLDTSSSDTDTSSSSSTEEAGGDRFLITGASSLPISYSTLQLRPIEELEVQSLSEDGGDPLGESGNSSGMEAMNVFPGVMAATFAMQDNDDSVIHNSEASSESADSELSMQDYWACVQCKEKNNNPLFRFCERCFKERKEFYTPRPFRTKTRSDLNRERKERRNKRMEIKNHETSDLSSEEEEVAAKKVKVSCSQTMDSGISCSSQEMQSQDVTVSIHCASILDRLYNRQQIGNLVTCGGVDVVDGAGDDKAEDKTTDKDNASGVRTGTDKVSVGSAAGGTVVSEKLVSDKVGLKRPAAESCSSLRSSSILDESMFGGTSDEKRPVLDCPESCSSVTQQPPQRSDVMPVNFCPACRRGPDGTRACSMCYEQPRNATFVHSGTGHTVSCYSCALKIWKSKKICPICNLKITNVIKNYMVG